jgi:hypothetical protein
MSEIVATREFKPSLQRVAQAIGQDSRSQGDIWFGRCMPVLILGCIAWVAFELLSTGNLRVLEGIAVGLAAAALVWFLLVWAMSRFVESRPHIKSALTPRRYKFDAETLFLETTDGLALRAPYRTFSRISIGPDSILFYESFPGLAAHVIPSEAFESKDQEQMVKDWLAVYAA